MTFPSSGPISFSQIAKFFTGSNTQVSMNDQLTRLLTGDLAGTIKMSDVYNKPAPGSASFLTPGTYSLLIPVYQTLNVTVMGAGGGGGGGDNHNIYGYGNCGYDGLNGGNSQFLTVVAYGGGYGGGDCSGHPGINSGGTGGTVTVGGGSAGGHGGWPQQGSGNGYAGGAGGRVDYSWTFGVTSGYPAWATYVTLIVGAGGGAPGGNAGPGSPGAVYFTWS